MYAYWNAYPSGRGALLVPCLTNAFWWQGENLFDVNEVINKVDIGDTVGINALITKSHCLSFNGVDNTINLGANVADYTEDFTVLIRAKVDTATSRLLSRRDALGTQFDFSLSAIGRPSLYDGANTVNVLGDYADGLYHDFAFSVYNNGTAMVYADNVVASGALTVTSYIVDTLAGSWNNALSGLMTGCMASLQIINNSLTQSEIQAEFLKTNNLHVDTVNYFSLSYGAGSVLIDQGAPVAYNIMGTLSSIWDNFQNIFNNNLINGFSSGGELAPKIPNNLGNPDLDALLSPLTNPAKINRWNFSENEFIIATDGVGGTVTYSCETLVNSPDVGSTIFFKEILSGITQIGVEESLILDTPLVLILPTEIIACFDYGLGSSAAGDGFLYFLDNEFNETSSVDVLASVNFVSTVYFNATFRGRDLAIMKDGSKWLGLIDTTYKYIFLFTSDGVYTGNYININNNGGAFTEGFPESCCFTSEGGQNYVYASGRDVDSVHKYSIGTDAGWHTDVGTYIESYDVSAQGITQTMGFKLYADGFWYLIDNVSATVFKYNFDWSFTGFSKNIGFFDAATFNNWYGLTELPNNFVIQSGVRIPDGIGGFEDSTSPITLADGGSLVIDIGQDHWCIFDRNWDLVAHFVIEQGGVPGSGDLAMTGVQYFTEGESNEKCVEDTLKYYDLWALMLNLMLIENTINYLTLL